MGDTEAADSFWFDLGDVAVLPLIETPRLLIEPEEFFPQLARNRSGWCFRRPWFDTGASALVYTIQSFLVITPQQTVLVDACVGDAKSRTRPQFNEQDSGWFARFEATGVAASQISRVIFTHLHVDHVGWATRRQEGAWTPTFPHARYCVTEPEYRYWVSSAGAQSMRRTGDYLADSVRPLEDHTLLDLVGPNAVFDPHVQLVPAFGHTPGNVCVRVSGADAELLLVGDTLHHPLQLLHPEWSTRYCVDPQQAAQTRVGLLAQAARSGVPILPSHFAPPSAGRIVPTAEGYGFQPPTDILRIEPYSRSSKPNRERGRRIQPD